MASRYHFARRVPSARAGQKRWDIIWSHTSWQLASFVILSGLQRRRELKKGWAARGDQSVAGRLELGKRRLYLQPDLLSYTAVHTPTPAAALEALGGPVGHLGAGRGEIWVETSWETLAGMQQKCRRLCKANAHRTT